MSLLINQGKQTETKNEFDIIEAKNVRGYIQEVNEHKFLTDNLDCKVKIIDEPFKDRVVYGAANYNPDSEYRWTYHNLRKSAGVPYQESENPNLDIEKLLLNKVVTMDLSAYTDKNGVDRQRVTWVVPKEGETKPVLEVAPQTTTINETPNTGWESADAPSSAEPVDSAIVINDDDLPF